MNNVPSGVSHVTNDIDVDMTVPGEESIVVASPLTAAPPMNPHSRRHCHEAGEQKHNMTAGMVEGGEAKDVR